jgi:hypothetical protein
MKLNLILLNQASTESHNIPLTLWGSHTQAWNKSQRPIPDQHNVKWPIKKKKNEGSKWKKPRGPKQTTNSDKKKVNVKGSN